MREKSSSGKRQIAKAREVAGEERGAGTERIVGNEEHQQPVSGHEALGPPPQEPLLKPSMDRVGVVGRIEEEKRGAVPWLDPDLEGIGLEDDIPVVVRGLVPVAQPAAGGVEALSLQLDGEDMSIERSVPARSAGGTEPEISQRADRLAVAGAGIDQDVPVARGGKLKPHQRG